MSDLLHDDAWFKKVVDVFSELFDRGLTDNAIWARAGGSLAAVDLSHAARTQWWNAFTEIKKGTHGITLEALIKAALDIYSKNTNLLTLKKDIHSAGGSLSEKETSNELVTHRTNESVVDVSHVTHSQKTLKIFLASSSELRNDREAFDLYFRQKNDVYRNKGVYLEIVRWENFLDAMSNTRLQDEYNKAIQDCDIFVSLFKTKTGKYTEEEFDVALKQFKAAGKPLIYTFFRETEISVNAKNRAALNSLWDFQDKLKELGHFHTPYKNIEDLKLQFQDQLKKAEEKFNLDGVF